jgi:hypothetical protein
MMRCGVPIQAGDPLNPLFIDQRSMMRRISNDCNRFQLDWWPEYNPLNNQDNSTIQIDGITLFVLTNYLKYGPDIYDISRPYSKPWNENDPFYPRALQLWEAKLESQKSFKVYLCSGFGGANIVAYGTMPEVKDGAVATITNDDQTISGTITLKMEFLP